MLYIIFVLLLPLILILAAPVINIILSVRRLTNKSTIPLWKSTILTFLLGMVLPILAIIVSLKASGIFNPTVKCLTGLAIIVPFGWLLTIVLIPSTSYIFYSFIQEKEKKIKIEENVSE